MPTPFIKEREKGRVNTKVTATANQKKATALVDPLTDLAPTTKAKDDLGEKEKARAAIAVTEKPNPIPVATVASRATSHVTAANDKVMKKDNRMAKIRKSPETQRTMSSLLKTNWTFNSRTTLPTSTPPKPKRNPCEPHPYNRKQRKIP
jgi:hypothetical protein